MAEHPTHVAWARDGGALQLVFLREGSDYSERDILIPVASVALTEAQLAALAAALEEVRHFELPAEGATYLRALDALPPQVVPVPIEAMVHRIEPTLIPKPKGGNPPHGESRDSREHGPRRNRHRHARDRR